MDDDLTGVPDGFVIPLEADDHACTWMLWPERTDTWRHNARPAEKAFAAVAAAIAAVEPVKIGVSPHLWKEPPGLSRMMWSWSRFRRTTPGCAMSAP